MILFPAFRVYYNMTNLLAEEAEQKLLSKDHFKSHSAVLSEMPGSKSSGRGGRGRRSIAKQKEGVEPCLEGIARGRGRKVEQRAADFNASLEGLRVPNW